MNRRSIALLALGAVGFLGVAFVACGGSTSDNPATDAGSDATSKIDSGGTPDSSTPDTAYDPNYDSGAVSNPNKVGCTSGLVCSGSAPVCCANLDGGSCTDAGTTCQGLQLTCDERADCPSGQICCATVSGTTKAGSECAASCGTISVGPIQIDLPQFCKTNAECPGQPCMAVQCPNQTVYVCGGLPSAAKGYVCN